MVTLDLADTIELDWRDRRAPSRASWCAQRRPRVRRRRRRSATTTSSAGRCALVGRRAHVALVKRIPMGAGLGGGSADAARACCGGRASPTWRVAVALGADVPFCVLGGRAIVRGVGEVLEPLEPARAHRDPRAAGVRRVDTAACYRRVRRARRRRTRSHPRNDLTVAAESVAPRARRVRAAARGAVPAPTSCSRAAGRRCSARATLSGSARRGDEVVETRGGPVRLLVARTTGRGERCYLPAARRCQRVFFSIFLCFFLRMRLRRFLISDPMACGTLVGARRTAASRGRDDEEATVVKPPDAATRLGTPVGSRDDVSLVRLDHVQLAMPAGAEDDAVAFYAGLLGLERGAEAARARRARRLLVRGRRRRRAPGRRPLVQRRPPRRTPPSWSTTSTTSPAALAPRASRSRSTTRSRASAAATWTTRSGTASSSSTRTPPR